VVGHKEAPGRPALYATTRSFLDDLGLRSLEELPDLEDLGSLVEANASADPAASEVEEIQPTPAQNPPAGEGNETLSSLH
jgi:segregation and condensation protein B